jgi:hypothetical protein
MTSQAASGTVTLAMVTVPSSVSGWSSAMTVGLVGVGCGVGVAVAGMGVLVGEATAVFVGSGVVTAVGVSSLHAASKSKNRIKLSNWFLIAAGL